MESIKKTLLKEIAGLEKVPQGAYNIRVNGKLDKRNSTKDISISTLDGKDGIEIKIKKGVKNQSVHIPVILSQVGLRDVTYNDFYVGDDCDVLIVAGCGIHCGKGEEITEHSGVHSFHIGKNSKVRYVEKHIGLGELKAKKVMNPTTKIFLDENATLIMETTQLNGVDLSNRETYAELKKGAKLLVKESVSTNLKQECNSNFEIYLKGEKSSAQIISRSVATDNSKMKFVSKVVGECECFGHIECDAIIQDGAEVISIPEIVAKNENANLVHEAVIGKLAPEQVTKLMTLGLNEKEAVETILKGFLN